MSLLDQAKREATRLFKLAKTFPRINDVPHIPINNLSEARTHIAIINGYDDWHAYEDNLKRKDFYQNNKSNVVIYKENRDVENLTDTYSPPIDFKFHNTVPRDIEFVEIRKHTPVILGSNYTTPIFSLNPQKWLLNSYPVYLNGTIGSGKTETLCALAHQYFMNKEGCFYIDLKSDASLYIKLLKSADDTRRKKDLYCLNYYKQWNASNNTIDPINPLIGQDYVFNHLFGTVIGPIIHAIAKSAQSQNLLLDLDNIKAILDLNNMLSWCINNTWPSATSAINTYIISLLPEDYLLDNLTNLNINEFDKIKHYQNCIDAQNTLKILFDNCTMWSLTPSINIEDLIKNRKILIAMLPALEKNHYELQTLSLILMSQIRGALIKLERISNNINSHWTNIILDEYQAAMSNNYAREFFVSLPMSANWIFSSSGVRQDNTDVIKYALSVSNTYVLMKQETHDHTLMDVLKIKIIENIEIPIPIFHKSSGLLYKQKCGEAYVCGNTDMLSFKDISNTYINSKDGYHLNRLNLNYIEGV